MSNSLPATTEATVDYPAFHYAVLAEILTECATRSSTGQVMPPDEERTVTCLPPADALGIAEKLSIESAQDSELSHLTPPEEVLLLHLME